jgi:hypothetical protein
VSEVGLEKRVVQILCCDPNQLVLRKIVEGQHDVDFQYIAGEFPILTDDGYGFVDIVGRNSDENRLLLLECKPHKHLTPKARAQAQYYGKCAELYGLVQDKNLLGIYHRDILGEFWNAKSRFEVRPLIVDKATILRHSGISIKELLVRCRVFMLEWISDAYRVARKEIERTIPSDGIPIYIIDFIEQGKRRSSIGFYGLTYSLKLLGIEGEAVGAPLKLEPDKAKYETMQRIEKVKGSSRFSIQFHRYGHSRPMLFLEIDNEFSACFVHTGRHEMMLNGYYESAKVLSRPNRMFGIVQVEKGTYILSEIKSNRLTIELSGRRCSGELRLNFLDRIYMDDNINLSSTLQTTLENH